jgi:PAS domain S-box-containing protein
MNTAVYILGILLQTLAGVIALLQVRHAPRRLPWLLIAISSLLIVARRTATLDQFMKTGRELAAAEMLTLIISFLFFLGVVLMSRMFRDVVNEHKTLQESGEALRESEEKYRNILSSIEDGYHEVDLKGDFTFVSSSMVKILGYEESELIGTNYRKYMDELDARNVFKAYNEVYRTGMPSRHTGWEFIRKDGTKIAAEGSVSLVKSKDQVIGFRGIIREVTDKKKAEDTLRKSEEYFRAITENASDIILVVDKKGTITYASPSVDRILGLKPEELIGKSSLDLIVPEDFQRAAHDFGKAILTESTLVQNAFRVRHKDGSERVLEGVGRNLFKNPSVAGFVMNARDVTERKRTEEALHESEKRYRELNDFLPISTFEVDAAGSIVSFNSTALEVFRYNQEDFKEGMNALQFFAPEEWQRVAENMERVLQGISIPGREYTFLRKDGSKFVGLVYSSPIVREDKTVGIRGAIIDITERKEAEKHIDDALQFNRTILSASPVAVFTYNSSGQCVSANEAASQITGGTIEELLVQNFQQLDSWQRAGMIEPAENALKTGRAQVLETHIVTTFGKDSWFDCSFTPFHYEGELHLLVLVSDITWRKQAEEALHAANIYNRSLIEASLDPLVTIGPDGRIMDVNAETEGVTGYSRAELIGKDFSDYFTEPEKARAGYREVFRAGSLRDYPLEIRHRDGYITSVLYNASVYRNDAGDVVGVFAAARDITERKRAEEELVWKTAFLEAQAEASIDGILVVDDKGKVIQVNTNFINLMKVPQHIRDDTDDKPMLQHVTSLVKHPEQFLEKVIYLYEHPREISRDEIEFKDRMVLDRYSSPVIGEDGKYFGRIWTFRNITERKWAEDKLRKYSAELIEKNEEIREMSEQLWQAAKLATMGELSASVAHELNNPLATISMRAESLLTKTQQDGPMWRELKIIEQEIERMAIMTANLLQFSRRRQKEISTVDICEEIEKAMELIYYHLRKHNIVIRREFAREYPSIHADRQELRQLFLNLFTNASDAMPQGGTLTIRVTAPPESMQVIIEVADTGTGIPPEIISKVVEPFYTTKPEGKGTGLGLAICRRIVQEHSGIFDLASEGIPGRGTTARISLPINDGTNAARLRN